MSYIPQSYFDNIISVLSTTYDQSMWPSEIDFFRIKDILDSLSKTQIDSKTWLVHELKKHMRGNHDACYIIGGWYGFLSHLLTEEGFTDPIYNYELDNICTTLASKMLTHSNIKCITKDGLDLFTKRDWNARNKILICTACEHIDADELEFSISAKDRNLLVCLQSNNMLDIDSHINCHSSIDDFVSSLNLNTVYYAGTKTIRQYERYMVIGK